MRTATLTRDDPASGLRITFEVECGCEPDDWRVSRVVSAEVTDGPRLILPDVLAFGHHDNQARAVATRLWRARVEGDPGLREWVASEIGGGR